ncbi:MAG: ABC transporter permease, partial [Alphaproteobacteria bacterium]
MTTLDATPAPALLPGRDRVAQWGIAAITLMLVAAPLIPILYQSFSDRPLYDGMGRLSLDNYVNLFGSAEFLKVIWNTLALGALTTVIGTAIGVVAAIVIGRTDMPGRALIGEMLIWPLYISHLVLGFGFSVMYGPSGYVTLSLAQALGDAPWDLYTIPGMAIICAVAQAPVTYLFCIASTQAADPSLEDAARISGARPFRALWSISMPLLRPAIVYAVILNFTVALELLAIPLLFGRPAGYEFLTTYL